MNSDVPGTFTVKITTNVYDTRLGQHLLVPQGTHDLPPNEGIVLAIGDGPPDIADFRMPVKPGDHVVFPRSAGVWVEIEDERLLVCRVRELLGVIEDAGAFVPERH